MVAYITLTCPSCGGKLEITEDIERFACSHCGREHVVKRGGGIISLSPVVEGLKKVEIGVDKTAAELALGRIPNELAALIAEKNSLLKTSPCPRKNTIEGLILEIICTGVLLISSIYIIIGEKGSGVSLFFCGIPGIVGILYISYALAFIPNRERRWVEAKEVWERTTGVSIKSLNKQIASKQAELERNRILVSQ